MFSVPRFYCDFISTVSAILHPHSFVLVSAAPHCHCISFSCPSLIQFVHIPPVCESLFARLFKLSSLSCGFSCLTLHFETYFWPLDFCDSFPCVCVPLPDYLATRVPVPLPAWPLLLGLCFWLTPLCTEPLDCLLDFVFAVLKACLNFELCIWVLTSPGPW